MGWTSYAIVGVIGAVLGARFRVGAIVVAALVVAIVFAGHSFNAGHSLLNGATRVIGAVVVLYAAYLLSLATTSAR